MQKDSDLPATFLLVILPSLEKKNQKTPKPKTSKTYYFCSEFMHFCCWMAQNVPSFSRARFPQSIRTKMLIHPFSFTPRMNVQ